MKLIGSIAIICLIGWIWFGWFKPPVYTGYFYYDINDLDEYWQQNGLASLEACQDWVNSQLAKDYDGIYDYECGKNCTYREGYQSVICETTEK